MRRVGEELRAALEVEREGDDGARGVEDADGVGFDGLWWGRCDVGWREEVVELEFEVRC